MEPVNPRILTFIQQHHVLTLAVSHKNIPWCASCFYCYLPDRNLFVFTSDADTRHIKEFLACGHTQVSGTIALETKITGKIRGIQFSGTMRKLEGTELRQAKREYLSRFPVARLAKLVLWGVEPSLIKLTDNRLGFGRKLLWGASS
ncbi:MAG: pyridoxamine 5'-phosphate oxidase family protein [bacterium]